MRVPTKGDLLLRIADLESQIATLTASEYAGGRDGTIAYLLDGADSLTKAAKFLIEADASDKQSSASAAQL